MGDASAGLGEDEDSTTVLNATLGMKHAMVGLTKNAECELGEGGISHFGVATPMLINTWRQCADKSEAIDDAVPSEEEVEKTKEMV